MNTLSMPLFPSGLGPVSDLSAPQRAALAGSVIALHLLAAWGIWFHADTVTMTAGAPPITVALISDAPTLPTAVPAPPEPVPVPPSPQPMPVQPVPPKPAPVAVATKMPQDATVELPSPAPVKQVEAPPAPEAPSGPTALPGPVSQAAAPSSGPSTQASIAPPAPKILPSSAVRYLVQPALVYPRISRELGESGVVRLKVLVDEQGRTKDVLVLQSSGFSRLDQQAVQAMRQARFQPHLEDGVPRAVWVVAPLTFQLEDQ